MMLWRYWKAKKGQSSKYDCQNTARSFCGLGDIYAVLYGLYCIQATAKGRISAYWQETKLEVILECTGIA